MNVHFLCKLILHIKPLFNNLKLVKVSEDSRSRLPHNKYYLYTHFTFFILVVIDLKIIKFVTVKHDIDC